MSFSPVCYLLHVATPLTLSEVRSMLPAGLAADTAPTADAHALRLRAPDALTVARLLRGACSCDFVLERDRADREEERHLRARWTRLGLGRDRIIAALQTHRRAETLRPAPLAHWTRALAGFVAEHARNAGPTVYYLHFGPAPLGGLPEPRSLTAAQVTQAPGTWLPEGVPVEVTR